MSASRSLVCTECGTENPAHYAFCFACGKPLSTPTGSASLEATPQDRAQVACPKCKTANPEDHQYCAQCGARLRPRSEQRKTFGIPLAIGIVGGLVAAASSYTHGALLIRVVFSTAFGFAFWWALAASIAWLLRPSWRRAAAVGAAVLLAVVAGAVYIFTQAWTGQDLGYIELPTPRPTYAERIATPEPTPMPTSTGPAWRPPGWSVLLTPRSLRPPTPIPTACLPWQLARSYVGQYQCICGDVHHTQDTGGTFFIHFSDGNEAFYGFSTEYYWAKGKLEGKCVRICGTVQTNYGRPRILIDNPDEQVFLCR